MSTLKEDIIRLFTPERLLALNLEQWEQESEGNAPCYYLAYNTACAYSRLEKGKESLSWLEVALRMNASLKKVVKADKDMAFVNAKYKSEVAKLLQ